MLFIVTDADRHPPGEVSEGSRSRWRWGTACGTFFFLIVYATIVYFSYEARSRGAAPQERSCRVSECYGCGRNMPESCERGAASLLGECRRRAQGYNIVCTDCERGELQESCREFADRQDADIDLAYHSEVPALETAVPCFESGERLTCSRRTESDNIMDVLAGRVEGFPLGWAALAAATGCFALFLLSLTAKRRRPVDPNTWNQHPHMQQDGYPQPPQFGSGLGPAPMPVTVGVPVQGVPITQPVQSQVLTIQVPEGLSEGALLQVQTPSGAVISVRPPDGMGPGDTFQVTC